MSLPHVAPLLLRLSLAAAGAIALGGCSPIRLADDSPGEKGALRFEYSSSACLFGCALDRSALEGSRLTIVARGDVIADKSLTASVSNGAVGAIANASVACSCDRSDANGSSERSVQRSEPCAAGETKSCSMSVDIETTSSGDARLEIEDEAGVVVDAATIKVRPASRLEVQVRADGDEVKATDATYVVRAGQRVELQTTAFVADGSEAIFTQHGVSHDYGDLTILGPNQDVLLGRADVEDMIPKAAGETTVTVKAQGASTTARFRVTP